jgi:hypothetical protein
MNKPTYKIRITHDKYHGQYRVQLLYYRQIRLLWWTFGWWEMIYAAKGSVLLVSTLTHRWFVKYGLCESDLEDLTE